MNYLFICGCGHSGTSLMLSIFSNAKGVLALTDETRVLFKMTLDQFKTLMSQRISDQKMVVEKTPNHIYRLKDIINDKDSSALVLLRNPIDVVASLKKRGFSLSAAINRYRNDNSEMVKHVGHEKLLLLRYEALVSQTQQVLGVLSDRYKVDLIEGNLSRRTDDRIYWKSDGAFESAMTD